MYLAWSEPVTEPSLSGCFITNSRTDAIFSDFKLTHYPVFHTAEVRPGKLNVADCERGFIRSSNRRGHLSVHINLISGLCTSGPTVTGDNPLVKIVVSFSSGECANVRAKL